MVQSVVSIISAAGQALVNREMEDMEKGFSEQIYGVKKSHRKTKRCK